MNENKSIEEVFFRFLSQLKFDKANLDYSLLPKHSTALQILSDVGNSGTSIFDLCKCKVVFYSSNFGMLLGYQKSDYQALGQDFFAAKIHPEDALKCSKNGVSALKLFNNFSDTEKLSYKLVHEYRMLNVENQYTRLVEQYQVLELDSQGQIWLMLSIVDVSPNQEELEECKSQLLNFRTGKMVALETPPKAQLELTKREIEILKLVQVGLLSKEISNKLAISVHTVNTHRQRFLEKLGANNSFEAVMFASKFGLLD
jgi:DNA-binding CsgD family transcriptional regulator